MKPVRPPLAPHPYVPDGLATAPGRDEGCLRCPLPKSRADVHTMPEVPADVRAAEARRVGER
jgi:hypothetical protein